MYPDYLFRLDVTEHRNLVLGRGMQRFRSQQPTGDLCKWLGGRFTTRLGLKCSRCQEADRALSGHELSSG